MLELFFFVLAHYINSFLHLMYFHVSYLDSSFMVFFVELMIFCSNLRISIDKQQTQDKMETRFECNICGKSFASGDSLRNHNYSMHEVKRDLQCGECHKLFSHQSIFKTHFKNVHEAIKTMHKCDVCDTSLSSKMSLRDHINSLHLEKKDFQCGECGKLFTHQKLLKTHFQSSSDQASFLVKAKTNI